MSPPSLAGQPARMSVADLVRTGTQRLGCMGSDSPRLDAEILIRHLTGWTTTQLFMHYPDPAPADLVVSFEALVDRRRDGTPVAYLTGEREFMGLAFTVTPAVLVPRPETEILVEWAIDVLKEGGASPATLSRPMVVDVGTGSGAIAVSVAAMAKEPVTVIATDLSADALEVARSNADRLLPADRRDHITFGQGSLLEPVTEKVSLVLANLPYLTPDQIAGNPDLDREPRMALDGGNDGLDLVRALIADLTRVLVPGGGVGLELDPDQCAAVEGLLRDAYPGRSIRTIQDLAGRDRHVVMEPTGSKENRCHSERSEGSRHSSH